AGVNVVPGVAKRRKLAVRVKLKLAGAGAPAAELLQITTAIAARLAGLVNGLAPGGALPRARLLAAAMVDQRVIDADVTLTPDG
ncbi:hypothetical protein ABTA40_19825, partial [Acinetobacter baumannii]